MDCEAADSLRRNIGCTLGQPLELKGKASCIIMVSHSGRSPKHVFHALCILLNTHYNISFRSAMMFPILMEEPNNQGEKGLIGRF